MSCPVYIHALLHDEHLLKNVVLYVRLLLWILLGVYVFLFAIIVCRQSAALVCKNLRSLTA